jgi:hypothetical protein
VATITKRIEVCDVCRDIERPILHRVRISMDAGKLRAYSLCEGDSLPLTNALAALGTPAAAAAPRRASRQVTLDQIEVVKEQRPVPVVAFIKGV